MTTQTALPAPTSPLRGEGLYFPTAAGVASTLGGPDTGRPASGTGRPAGRDARGHHLSRPAPKHATQFATKP